MGKVFVTNFSIFCLLNCHSVSPLSTHSFIHSFIYLFIHSFAFLRRVVPQIFATVSDFQVAFRWILYYTFLIERICKMVFFRYQQLRILAVLSGQKGPGPYTNLLSLLRRKLIFSVL